MRQHIFGLTEHPKPASTHSTGGQETVASYLNKRLAEIGVQQFAIPGDYIADYVNTLDDSKLNAGLTSVVQHSNTINKYN